jgi:hypothetical protein
VTIQPRRPEGTSPGTGPGTTPGFLPGELPAPPHVATPQGLELELGALDTSVGDDRADADAAADVPPGVGEPVGPSVLGLSGDDTGEATRPGGAKKALGLLPEDLPTIERRPASGLDDLDAESEFEATAKTSERGRQDLRSPFAGDSVSGAATARKDVQTPVPGGPAVIIDEQLLKAYDEVSEDGEVTTARDSASGPVSAGGADERLRARVTELLALARDAAERGDHLSAVEAAEAASAEDPDGKVAPVILHRHRDLLYRIYEGHIGEMSQVPLLAVPLQQIAAEKLDHRAGFLLSRIDGMLSFEDILDVSGMPRLDAYRILSELLRRGFIEVR